jgi:hypothetical protein
VLLQPRATRASTDLEWEETLGRFAGQHDAVGTVENRVGDVRRLGPGRSRLLDHAFEHLSGADDRLAGPVAATDHHLLREKDLLGGYLDAEIASRDHHAVGHLENLVEPLDALVVLDLCHDLDVFALLAQYVAYRADAVAAADERGEDDVDALFDAELEVFNVTIGHGWEIDRRAWQVAALLAAEQTAVFDDALQVVHALFTREKIDMKTHIEITPFEITPHIRSTAQVLSAAQTKYAA